MGYIPVWFIPKLQWILYLGKKELAKKYPYFFANSFFSLPLILFDTTATRATPS